MEANCMFRGLLSGILTVALLLSALPYCVSAEENLMSPTETTVPAETRPPEVTEPASDPCQETEATQPQETEPDLTKMTIRYAKTLEAGTENVVIQGTLTYAGYGMTVIQDSTGGIRLRLPENTGVTPGEVLLITGTRSEDGIDVRSLERKGSAELPVTEATLNGLEEYIRVTMENLTFSQGCLIHDAVTIPMTPAAPSGITSGMQVRVWGVKAEGMFYADRIEPVITLQPLPSVTAAPLDGTLDTGENIALSCEEADAAIYYQLSYDGLTYGEEMLYHGGVTAEESRSTIYLRAYATKEGFLPSPEAEFRFTRQAVSSSEEDSPGSSDPESPPSDSDTQLNFYFGQLHAHTNLSDGIGTVEEAFAYASQVEGLDFFAVTDHSNSFDNAAAGAINQNGALISEEWRRGKEAAAAVTGPNFVGIFGYELTWRDLQQYGHINTFNTLGWQTWDQAAVASPKAYYETLTTAPGSVSQFNHPGTAYGSFEAFANYSPQYDARISLLEVGGEYGVEAYQYYTQALDLGWHVAPTNNQTNHEGNWGDASAVRTVILAPSLTEQALYTAMENRRVYATQDADQEILYRLNDALMGSVIYTPAQTITVSLSDPTDAAGAIVDVVAKNGEVLARQRTDFPTQTLTFHVSQESPYYYLRITQADGDIAVTAPVWVDLTEDVGISQFTADSLTPTQGDPVNLNLEVFNNEAEPFLVESVAYYLEDALFHSLSDPEDVPALGSVQYPFPFSYSALGPVKLRAVVTGTLRGTRHSFEQELVLTYQSPQTDLPITAISEVRRGTSGETYRIQGYVTAGTSNPRTTFPGTLYLQDSTGGIAVSEFWETGIQVGTPLTITGYLDAQNGNPTLVLLSSESWNQPCYRYTPQILSHRSAMDPLSYGGQLLQVEGKVVSLTRTTDGRGISWFTMKDAQGDIANIRIEPYIVSASTGENRLNSQVKVGATVQAVGILHLEAGGNPVLRVRNCDEVTAISDSAASVDPSNPKTGDLIFLPVFFLSGFLGLCLLRKRRK